MRAIPCLASQRVRAGLCAVVLTAVSAGGAFGQSIFSTPGSGGFPPSSPGANLAAPGGGVAPSNPAPLTPAPAPPAMAPQAPVSPVGQVALYLAARFGPELPYVSGGLIWRVYSDKPEANGVFRLFKEERTSAPAFLLPAGGYVVHATFGHATATKHIQLRAETVREIFDLPAGGIKLEGKVGDVRIPAGQISFDIYKGSQFEAGDKRPLTQGVMTGDVMLVPEGTYMIVSNYGDGNAVVRSDIRVRPGQVTDVTVTHRAAVITLKLVNSSGGEAIANTAWSVLTPGGDVIKESIGAFPRVILTEGDYKAIARNDGKVFERDFKVITGVDAEITVVAR